MSDVRNPMSESAYPYPARYGGSAISIVPLVVVIAAVIASTAMNGRAMVGMVAHYVGVKTETVEFYSEGARLRGFLHRPDAAADRLPFIVQGPGWLGLADAKLYAPYHEAFTDAGFAVLIFDYRGFGESEGDRGTISPTWQLQDWRSAIAFMRGRPDMEPERAAIFGSGGTGGGNAVLAAAAEPEIRATISQVPVADGRDWLHRMRPEHEWVAPAEDGFRQRGGFCQSEGEKPGNGTAEVGEPILSSNGREPTYQLVREQDEEPEQRAAHEPAHGTLTRAVHLEAAEHSADGGDHDQHDVDGLRLVERHAAHEPEYRRRHESEHHPHRNGPIEQQRRREPHAPLTLPQPLRRG